MSEQRAVTVLYLIKASDGNGSCLCCGWPLAFQTRDSPLAPGLSRGWSPEESPGETLISAFLNPKIHLLAQAPRDRAPQNRLFQPPHITAPHHQPRPGVWGEGGGGRRWGPQGEEVSCLNLRKGRSLIIGASYPGSLGGAEGGGGRRDGHRDHRLSPLWSRPVLPSSH